MMSNISVRRGKAWLPVAVCTLILPLCALVIHPWAEIGMVDDWSYIRTAQMFADTGHVVYNGWAAAMLGWQILVGALMFKIFGFSFGASRVGTLLLAMGVGGLLQRLYVRLGLSEWNSAAVTLIFLCSPPMIATTFSFMSDVYGILVMLGCCYCCVRALQAERASVATAWVCAAAIGTGVGGTARQIAWLSLLIMVPCTLWLLRRNRKALVLGGACTVIGMAMVPASLHWYNQQPFSLRESPLPTGSLSARALLLTQLPDFAQKVGFELLFLSLPLLVVLLFVLPRRRTVWVPVAVVLLYWAIRVPLLLHAHKFGPWTAPYLINNLWFSGWEELRAYLGNPAILLTKKVQFVLTALVLAGELGLVGLLFLRNSSQTEPAPQATSRRLSARELVILFAPCTLIYVLLLIPRYLGLGLLDRYLIFPEFVFLGGCVLLYQARIGKKLPAAIWLTVGAYVVINTMGMHDAFNLFRAQATLLDRVQQTGVARTQIDGGIEFNGWTQIVTVGHLNDPRIQIPANSYLPIPTVRGNDPCHTEFLEMTPSIHARYVVSFDPHACGGATGMEESYSTWLGRKRQTLYMVKGPE